MYFMYVFSSLKAPIQSMYYYVIVAVKLARSGFGGCFFVCNDHHVFVLHAVGAQLNESKLNIPS